MLAKALIRSLRARGLEPAAPSRAALDIGSFADVMQIIEKVNPTLVINCAAHTKVDLCEDEQAQATEINGSAVGVLAAAAKDVGAKLVHYSTDFVFNGDSTRAWREDDPTDPLSAYGRSKLLGEHLLAREGGSGWLLLRTAWLYGPGGPCFPMTMINAARAGKPLKVVDDQIGSPTFTRDLGRGDIEPHRRGRDRNLSPGQRRADELARFHRRDPRRIRIEGGPLAHYVGRVETPAPQLRRPSGVQRS